jgi:DNA-binding response OmpR family regulator
MPTALLVDDSQVALRALARRLGAEGFAVRTELTAASARTIDPGELACAVIDLELADGDGDGTELAANLRARRATLPIAFFTAGASPELLARAHVFGPIFTKPNLDAVAAWAKHVSVARQPPPTK